jgi:hypothetical protein
MSEHPSAYDHEVQRHDPREGFDRSDPQVGAIAAFTVGSAVLLILVIFAITAYFNKLWEQAVHDKILVPPSEELNGLHNREDWNLTHYGYMDKPTGVVRLPLARATELFTQEVASGKPFYPGKPSLPKKDDGPTPDPVPGAAVPAAGAVANGQAAPGQATPGAQAAPAEK